MEIRSSLSNGTPSSGPVGGAHRRLSAHRKAPRSVRARVVRGILVLALSVGSIGAVTAAVVGHDSGAQGHGKVAIFDPWML